MNSTATFRFYAELNELLPRDRRQREILHVFRPPATLKDRIEAQGVPHVDVDLILRNGEAAGFEDFLEDGDRVSVYPYLAVTANPRPLRPPFPRGRFVLDQHLARLAAYLRLLGQDVLHREPFPDEELARIAAEEERVLLSRDKGLLMRRIVVHGAFVRATDPKRQVIEVLHRFGAPETFYPFSRCLCCNALLEEAPVALVADRLPPATRRHYDRYWVCHSCGRVFWEGPHVRRMRAWVAEWLAHPDLAHLRPANLDGSC